MHSHYWLSGWVGSRAKRIWGVPLVTSFHTLAKVKNASSPQGEFPEPEARLLGEQRVIRHSDRVGGGVRNHAIATSTATTSTATVRSAAPHIKTRRFQRTRREPDYSVRM